MKKAFVLTMVVMAAAFAFEGCKDDGKKAGGKEVSEKDSGEYGDPLSGGNTGITLGDLFGAALEEETKSVKPQKLSKKNGITGNTFVNTNKEHYSFEKLVFNKDASCIGIDGDEQEIVYYQVDEKEGVIYIYKMMNPDGTLSLKIDALPYEMDKKGNVVIKPVNKTNLKAFDEEFIKE